MSNPYFFTFWDFKLAERELFGWYKGYCSLSRGTPFKCLIQMVKSLFFFVENETNFLGGSVSVFIRVFLEDCCFLSTK